ncbi:cobalt-zinc-cadmium efflux system membrane fusion protein [Variovorax sp. TBS-050B]|uniref:efflux RND transporter periplasmic adaptor subunit n=1 Tax=Variovorax sp. TBS-050B TaxID=2940551 RepID=UPI0024764753|nr:efflux RND transporter periplasmic adaptor subunit [Variovorax sp. TBS-050B]MDH6590237.1 cobalt-zinc-cadmium efflux system membrane fusion protein [Variovorax sp. TBS-050B]
MTSEQKKPTSRIGRKQAIAIALIVVFGLVAGALILRAQPGRAGGEDEHGHSHGAAEQHAGEEEDAHGHDHEEKGAHKKEAAHKEEGAHADEKGKVAITEAQAQAAGIAVEASTPAPIRQALQFPGEIRFNEDRTAHVVPRVAGVVERVSADLGQQVRKGQVLAVIASATVSEQRSELGAAQKRRELAAATYAREQKLWEEKISPEQDVLQARQALREAEIAVANASQKLAALGAPATGASLGQYELRAPFDGMVVEKHIALGESVKEDANVFTISDLSTVWAEMNIGAKELPRVRVGEKVTVRASAFDATAEGRVAYVGSLIGEQTRTARARVTLANPQLAWRPGLFVNVEVVADEASAPVTVVSEAVQTVDGKPVVFVAVEGGFVARPVQTGRSDGRRIEIVSGLAPGVRHAAAGSFVVKSQQGKGSATHTH